MSVLSTPTLQDLLTSTRIMLSSNDPENSYWTDPELTEYLNEGVRLYFGEAVQANEGYFTTTGDLDIAANTELVSLPTDCFQVKNLWKKVTNGYILLRYNNSVTDSYSTQGGTSSEAYLPYYYFRGNSLVLRPTPNFAETSGLKIEYIQFPDQMLYGGDQMSSQVSPVFKQLIVMYAVYKAKLRESMVNGVIMHEVPRQNVDMLYTQFKDLMQRRSKNPTYIIPFSPENE